MLAKSHGPNGPQGPQGPQVPVGQGHLEFIETKVNSNNLTLNLHLNPMDHRDHRDKGNKYLLKLN